MQPVNQTFLQAESAAQHSFVLLQQIQKTSCSLQQPNLLLFNKCKNHCLSICVQVITKVLRLFENS